MIDKLELKSCHEVVDTVYVAEVNSIFYGKPTDPDILTVVIKDGKRLYCDEVCPIDSLHEEPASKDLEEEVDNYVKRNGYDGLDSIEEIKYIAQYFTKWQNEHLWKPADGDDLPGIDREVVALQEIFPTDIDVPSLLIIVIAHRPNTKGYDGKSIATGKVEHYTPKTYDKGGWNIPNVKYWLDVELPKEIEL